MLFNLKYICHFIHSLAIGLIGLININIRWLVRIFNSDKTRLFDFYFNNSCFLVIVYHLHLFYGVEIHPVSYRFRMCYFSTVDAQGIDVHTPAQVFIQQNVIWKSSTYTHVTTCSAVSNKKNVARMKYESILFSNIQYQMSFVKLFGFVCRWIEEQVVGIALLCCVFLYVYTIYRWERYMSVIFPSLGQGIAFYKCSLCCRFRAKLTFFIFFFTILCHEHTIAPKQKVMNIFHIHVFQ